MAKFLVTGGIGGVGSNLVEKLVELGHEVSILDNMSRGEESTKNWEEMNLKDKVKLTVRDVLNFKAVREAVLNVDGVFHLAALPSHRLAMKDPLGYATTDIIGTVNVLESIRQLKQPTKVLFASSNKVYGHTNPPFSELMIKSPEGPYGLAKAQSEEWCELYNKYYGVPISITRLHHIVGPRMQPDLALSIFVENALKDEDITVHGQFDKNGDFASCSAAFTNVFDAVDGMIKAMEYVSDFEIFNIGAETETTVEHLGEMAITWTNSHSRIIRKQMYSHESLHHAADSDKAQRLLGWKANTPIEVSVDQYMEWRKKRGERLQAKYND